MYSFSYIYTCPLKNLYAGQEATIWNGYGTTDFFKIGKGVYCQSVYLISMQGTSHRMPGLESRLLGEISATSDMQMIPLQWQNVKRTKEPLDEGERGE